MLDEINTIPALFQFPGKTGRLFLEMFITNKPKT